MASIGELQSSIKSQRPKQPFLSLVDASFRLGDQLVFANTSWVFHRHEHWAIVGPNGCGKSLFADALRARIPLVRGELNYHFRPMPGLSAEESIAQVSFENRKAEIHGTVVQSRWNSSEVDDALRVRDFLSYDRVMDVNPFEVGRNHAAARKAFAQRQRSAVALLHLQAFLDRPLLSLSNGETQRAQLARALSQPARLLMLDEPFIGLDVATRAHFHRALERLMSHSLRILLITTRVEDLPGHITHLLYVDSCRIVQAGTKAEVLRAHALKPLPRLAKPRRFAGKAFKPAPSGPQDASPVLIDLRNVSVRYGSATILRNVTWSVRPGESWALLGPNGSGKTTLLSLILGDNPQAYSNEVTVFGKKRGEGESVWEIKQHIGWVSPELQLHFGVGETCFGVVASGYHDAMGFFEPISPQQRRQVRNRLAEFGLTDFAEAPFSTVSAGQQRMVLLARALVKHPALLILDEPCQGLDPGHRRLFVKTLDRLIQGGAVTAIFVTHRSDEIPNSVARIIRLAAGRATLHGVHSRK